MASADCHSTTHSFQVHFLTYLDCLRNNEYSAALDSHLKTFNADISSESLPIGGGDSSSAPGTSLGTRPEEAIRGFRYAALNLVALHSRFGYGETAIAALKEAITMAQSANDRVCLQHALGWLLRMQKPDQRERYEDRKITLEKAVEECGALQLSYLRGLGFQSMARLELERGEPIHGLHYWREFTFKFMQADPLAMCGTRSRRAI